jgi:hypothetical protein
MLGVGQADALLRASISLGIATHVRGVEGALNRFGYVLRTHRQAYSGDVSGRSHVHLFGSNRLNR